MNTRTAQKEAKELHELFVSRLYENFGISKRPENYPIGFEPLLSLGGLKRNINFGLEIVLNDTLLIDPIDRLQFEQTIWHETGHILHLIGNGWKIGEETNNNACNEPIGSIIADLGVLVFSHSTKRKAKDYFGKLSDYAGPAKELFILAESKGFEYPERLLREMSKQTVRELYQTVKSYLGQGYLYDDRESEDIAREQAAEELRKKLGS